MEIRLLAQFTRKQKFVDFFVQDLEALGEIEGIPNIIDKGTTNEFLKEHPYAYINVPSLEAAQRLLTRSVLIKTFNLVFGEGIGLDEARKAVNKEKLDKFMAEHEGSIAFRIEVTNQTTTGKVYTEHIGNFIKDLGLLSRKIDLQNPDIVFKFIEVYKYGTTTGPLKSYFAVELLKNPSIHAKFALTTRAYLGPTTTDHELAFLMANQALVRSGSFVYDPFCGTCGILLICSHFGAKCIGSDLDMRVLKGLGVARVSEKMADKIEAGDVYTNFDLYGLERPDIVRMDFTQPPMREVEIFDAVICDPPYGIRAGSKKFGKHSKKEPKLDLTEEEKKAHLPSTVQHKDMYKDVLENAAKYVKVGGRLVILFPTSMKWEPAKNTPPTHPCFQLIRDSKNELSAGITRHMLTYKKVLSFSEHVKKST